MKLTTREMMLIAAAAFALYWLWKKSQAIADTIAAPIADAIIGATLPPDVQVLGTIILPSGASIPVQGLVINSLFEFTHAGHRYRLVSRNGQVYTAVTV